MAHAFICDYVSTPIGRYGGGLAIVRADDLGAVPIKALMARNNQVDWVLSLIKLSCFQINNAIEAV